LDFDQTLEAGDAASLPIGLGLEVGGVGLELSLGLSLDRTVAFTQETGVFQNGELFTLAKYDKDALIPDLNPSTADDLLDLASIGFKGIADHAAQAFSVVTSPLTSGLNTLRSLFTAQLDFDGTNEPPFDPALVSFHYQPIPGPVALLQFPWSVTGAADRPHYGIGGFHQFVPDGRILAVPATLTIFYEESEVVGVDKTSLAIYRWDRDQNDWVFIGGVDDPASDTVKATVDRFGLYTAAPPMPGGTITFTAQSTTAGDQFNPHTIVTYTSGPLVMNNGQGVPDGMLYTVAASAPGTIFSPFGTVTSTDQDPATDGTQVSAHGGVIQFTVDYPAAAGSASAIAFSTTGTARGLQTLPLQ
jgi:hypothetical protein